VDTHGQVGANVTLSGYFGIGDEDGLGFVPVVEVGAGAQFNPAWPAVDYAVGWDLIQTEDEELALRVGVRMHARWIFLDVDGEAQTAGVEAVTAGSLGPLRRYHLSVEFRGGIAWDGGFGDSNPLGTFALNLVYDRLTTWNPLDDF